MLQMSNPQYLEREGFELAGQQPASLHDLTTNLLGIVRRRWLIILIVCMLSIALAVIYVAITPPQFTAIATLLIDNGKVKPVDKSVYVETPLDAATIESQIQVLRSESLALSVVEKLDLAGISARENSPLAFSFDFSRFRNLFHRAEQVSTADPVREAGEFIRNRLKVERAGTSFAVHVSFTSSNAERAAQIPNALVEAYIEHQSQERNLTTQQATIWLQNRIQDLRQRSTDADQAVADFKAKHNIVQSGKGSLNEQLVSDLNTRLETARALTSEAEARLNRIEQILRDGDAGTVTETLNNSIINELRKKYLELTHREADWSARLGSNHGAVINVRRQIRETRDSLRDELGRIAEAYKSDYEIAKQRQASVERELAARVSAAKSADQAEIQLHVLENNARNLQMEYENVLQQDTKSSQQAAWPGQEARFVTRASAPVQERYQQPLFILLAAPFAGLALGFGLAFARDSLESSFRTPRQIASALQTTCLAGIPRVKNRVHAKSSSTQSKRACQQEPRVLQHGTSLCWYVANFPTSRLSEAVRAIKFAVDLRVAEKSKIIGFTSTLPSEGKSTVSANIAVLMAKTGARVILVDCDLRNPTISRVLTPNAKQGFVDVISGNSSLEEVIWKDPSTGLAFVPAGRSPLVQSAAILGSNFARQFANQLRESYDYVVMDLSPLSPVVDVRGTSEYVDAHVLVVEWGRTKRKLVEHALHEAQNIRDNLLGVVLNKVDMNKIHKYDSHLKDYYNNKEFSRYYGTAN
jgi:succinoglycan biosynthesis transport protein ExoP